MSQTRTSQLLLTACIMNHKYWGVCHQNYNAFLTPYWSWLWDETLTKKKYIYTCIYTMCQTCRFSSFVSWDKHGLQIQFGASFDHTTDHINCNSWVVCLDWRKQELAHCFEKWYAVFTIWAKTMTLHTVNLNPVYLYMYLFAHI